jgi:RNA polymerase sigma-70 factor (ECF subfamily)
MNFRAVLAGLGGPAHSDGDLLRRYVAERDEEAFAELVRRLGPGVWSACRRLLAEPADAEDAFQATFLVLARKAGSIRPPGKVAAWLHGAAMLTARKARSRNRRLTARIRFVADPPDKAAAEANLVDPALHEELDRLPERFRLPILLCELRELTAAQAARELGWPVGTVASRLSRGRVLLMERLRRRGFAATTMAGVLTAGTANAAVPVPLLAETLSLVAAPAGTGSVSVLSLTSEVIQAMSMTKLNLMAAGAVATVALALSVSTAATPGTLPAATPIGLPAAPPPERAATPAADPIDRFKLENLMGLLMPEEIQADLRVSEEQKKSLEEARTDYRDQMQAAMRKIVQAAPVVVAGPGGGRVTAGAVAGTNPAFVEAAAAFDKTAVRVLSAEQQRRLRQLTIQLQGPRALLDRRVIRPLALSAEQEDAIDAELPALTKSVTDAASYVTESEKVMGVVLKVLNADQRAKWDALIGKPMAASDLVKAHPVYGETTGFAITGGARFGGGPVPPAPQPPRP